MRTWSFRCFRCQTSYENLQIQPKLPKLLQKNFEIFGEKTMPVSICLAKHLAPCQWCHTHGSDPMSPLFAIFPKQRNQHNAKLRQTASCNSPQNSVPWSCDTRQVWAIDANLKRSQVVLGLPHSLGALLEEILTHWNISSFFCNCLIIIIYNYIHVSFHSTSDYHRNRTKIIPAMTKHLQVIGHESRQETMNFHLVDLW